jgi:hypothetical protein
MFMQKVIRTKMASALLAAQSQAAAAGVNTGRLGRNILTADAAGVGVKARLRTNPKKEVGHGVGTFIPLKKAA